MPKLSRNAQVLRYLLEVAPGVGHTLLAKFAYLADLIARQYLGGPITEMQYRYDNHGPFDAVGFYRALGNHRSVGNAIEQAAAILEDTLCRPCCRTRKGMRADQIVLSEEPWPRSDSGRARMSED